MTHPRFFGYGSLVNTATHAYPDPVPTSLRGWHRQWVCLPEFEVAVLSVRSDLTTQIDGLTAQVPGADWQALDQRERGYARHVLPEHAVETSLYAVPEANEVVGDHVILLSYLDVVLQGFLHRFGPDGPARFMATTDRWRPIFNDRANPRYPRHQTLAPEETAMVDALITTAGLTLQRPSR